MRSNIIQFPGNEKTTKVDVLQNLPSYGTLSKRFKTCTRIVSNRLAWL